MMDDKERILNGIKGCYSDLSMQHIERLLVVVAKAREDERQRIIVELKKHVDCRKLHEIDGEPATCLDMVLFELGVRRG